MDKYSTPICSNVPIELARWLDGIARKMDTTRSKVIRDILTLEYEKTIVKKRIVKNEKTN